MKIKQEFIRKVYRLGIVDTRNYRYCFYERATSYPEYPAIVRFKRDHPYDIIEELVITNTDILQKKAIKTLKE